MNPSTSRGPDKTANFIDRIVAVIRGVIDQPDAFLALHEPCFRGREWQYVKDCLDTGWVSSVGQYVNRFEEQLVDITGSRYAVATSSGTAALHTSLILAGTTRDDEVLVPSLSFVATANAVTYTGALPHFIDCDETTFGVDPERLEIYLREIAEVRAGVCYNKHTGRRIAAVIAVHVFGHPCQIDAIAEIAARFQLTLIEDAAESLGTTYQGRHTGRWGRLAVLSFNGNKTITTGGGGAVLTDDRELAELAKHLTTTARLPHQWESRHDKIGYNYRLPNLNAALGCAQVEQLPTFIESKRELARRYSQAFASVEGVQFVSEPHGARSNYWLCTLLFDENYAGELEMFLQQSNNRGVMTRPAWNLLSGLPMYADSPRASLSVSERVVRRLINIPSSPKLCLPEIG